MSNRRNFMAQLGGFLGYASFVPFLQSRQGKNLLESFQQKDSVPIDEMVRDEQFWHQIKQAYTVSPTLLNLNNGGVCPQPKVVQEAVERYNQLSNETPSYYMWRILDKGREPIREQLANLAGCSKEEIAINRNASEALETVIFGLPLEKGDEVILTKQDYPNMINAWKQRAQRDGIVLKWLSFDFPITDKEIIVNRFVEAFTPQTKLVHLTHMINWNGQLLPVKEIATKAKQSSIEVLVDGAHTFAHLNYSISDLNCDYFGTSLHKWLCAPFGSGMLYVKKEKIAKIYPLLAAPEPLSDDIRKFEHLGTRSFAIEQGIGQAISFHHMIGSELKAKRLFFLKNYWYNQLKDHPEITLGTPTDADWSGAIGLLMIRDKDPHDIANYLYRNHKIHCVGIKWENINGVRITPNVYTTTRDLDRLVKAVKQYIEA